MDDFLNNMFQQDIPQKQLPIAEEYPDLFQDPAWNPPSKGNLGPYPKQLPLQGLDGSALPGYRQLQQMSQPKIKQLDFLRWLLMKLKGGDPNADLQNQLNRGMQQQQQNPQEWYKGPQV